MVEKYHTVILFCGRINYMKTRFRNRIVQIFVAVLLLTGMTVPVFHLVSEQKRIKEENKIISDINSLKLVKYKDETVYSDLQILLELSSKKYSDSFLGFINERISFLYKSMGDDLHYYTSLGKALYYLEKGQNFQTMLNLYADLIDYQYIPNGNYDLAEQILLKIESIERVEGIKETRMKTTIYRIKGDVAYYAENYEFASEMYAVAEQVLQESAKPEQGFFLPIAEVHEARNLIELGKFSEAEKLLEKYIEIEGHGGPQNYPFEDVVIKLRTIPLYQTACCIYAHNGDYENLKTCIERLIDYAYKQSFERMALITLQKIKTEYALPPEIESFFRKKLDSLYYVIYLIDSKSYTDLCNSQINSTISLLEEAEFIRAEKRRNSVIIGSFGLLCAVLAFFALKIKQKSYIDELTGTFNRKYLNKKLAINEKRNIPYSVLMLDIDDFKHVNDTFGHDAGDIVLQSIGEILNYRCRSKKIEAFRYGGEEFTLLIYDTEILSPLAVAESIRREIMEQSWYFNERVTVSIGVADSTNSDKTLPLIKQADIFLYYAKKHGKNQVCNGTGVELNE